MNSSILAALVASILSLFGLHQPIAYRAPAPSQSAIVATAAAAITPNADSNADTQYAATSSAPVSDTSAPSPLPNYVTQAALNSQLSALEKTILSELQTLASAVTSIAARNPGVSGNSVNNQSSNSLASSAIQQQLDALQHEISQTNQINNLSNVTITSPSFSGVTTSNVPEGSNLYYTDARVTSLLSTAAATTTFGSGVSAAYLNITGSSATSTFANGIAVSGGCVSVNGTCLGTGGGGAGNPGGSNTQVQFNDGGNFNGNANFTFNKSGNLLTITNASTTNLTATYVSTTNLIASNSFTLGTLSGFLKAVSGVVSTAFVNLASDVTGILPVANGGTGISNPLAAGVLVGSYAGGAWQQLATSSLGLLTTNVGEGSNLYFTNTRVASVIAGTTTDALAQGSTNKYYSTLLFAADLAGTTTNALAEGSTNKYYTDARVGSYISGSSTVPHVGGSAYGNVLYWTGAAWATTATSSLGVALSDTTGTLAINRGGTGASSLTGLITTADFASANISQFTNNSGYLTSLTGAASSTLLSDNNTFTGTDIFSGALTLGSATTTNLFSTTASSTNLFAQTATLGSLSVNGTATSTFANGIALSGGCVSVNGTCLGIGGGGGGSGTVTSITAGTGLTGGTITTSGTVALDLTALNSWTGLQQFTAGASSTNESIFGALWVGGTATSSLQGNTTGTSTIQGFLNVAGTNSTSTFSGGLAATYLNLTGSSATSTASNGLNLSAGCFAVNGTCITSGGGGSSFPAAVGGSFTIDSGSVTAGNLVSLLADGNIAAAGSTAAGGLDLGAPVVVTNSTNAPTTITDLSSSAYVVTYLDSTNSSHLTTAACSASGTTVTCGTPVVVTSSTNAPTITDLSSTSYTLTYRDSTNSSKLTTVACSVSGTTVTCGTPVVVSNDTNAPPNAPTDLNSSTYAMEYLDSTNSSHLTTTACSVSGTTVTCGTPVVVTSSTNAPINGVVDLSSSAYVLTYKDSTNSSKLTTAACSVSGTTVTCGTPVLVSSDTTAPGFVIALSSSAYAMTYLDSTNSNETTTAACSVSGTTVTCGTPVVVSTNTNTPTVVDLSSSTYEMTFADGTNSNHPTTAACTVSGTTVTCGTPVVIDPNSTIGPDTITDLSSSAYVVTYRDNGTSKDTTAACTVSGTTVTCGTPVVVSNSTNAVTSTTDLNSSAYVLLYKDSTNSSKFTTVACSVSGTTVTCSTPGVVTNSTSGTPAVIDLNSSTYTTTYIDSTNSSYTTTIAGVFISAVANYPIGVAASSGTSGQSINVASEGVVGGFTGLALGTIYYANTDGTITATSTPNRLGVAVSSTQIQLSSNPALPNTSTQFFGDAVFANNFRITEAQNALQGLIFENQLGANIAELDETGKLSINSLNIADVPAASSTASSLCLDQSGDIVSRDGGCAPFATTTIDELLSTSTTVSLATSTPWIGAFADASDALQTELGSLTAEVIRVFDQPIYAAVGIFDNIIARDIQADTVTSQQDNTQQLCVGSTCVTPEQFQTMVAAANASQSSGQAAGAASAGGAGGSIPPVGVPPVIQINGDNPATIQVGASYTDLGATITGPQQDLNLGIKTFLNGTLTSNIVIDTTEAATDTIDYVATDQSGLTATTTRTVTIEPAPAPSIVSTDAAGQGSSAAAPTPVQ